MNGGSSRGSITGYRAGFVAIAGRSNVGKSTLLNRLVGQKVAIVSARPQTTRSRILGIRTEAGAQMLLVDAPGLHHGRNELSRLMEGTARRTLAEGEVVLAMIEASRGLTPADAVLLAEVRARRRPSIVVVNKIDLVPRDRLAPLCERVIREFPEAEVVPVSALSGENFDELVATIKALLPQSEPLMPADQYTDQTERKIAAEIIRERIFATMRQEIPFSTAVKVERFERAGPRRLLRIGALIVVEREAHKGILIGAQGRTLKEIGTGARLEIEKILDAPVFLELFVKVERNWTRDARKVAELAN